MLTPNFHPFPLLTTERLVLRPINANDAKELLKIRSDSRVMQYLDRPSLKNEEESLALIQRIEDDLRENNGITWVLSLHQKASLIGTIGFWRIFKDHHRAEIGYMLMPEYYGQGLMQEAMTAALSYGFGNMKLHSVEANVNPGNASSIRLLERNGFVREAYFRENYYYDGKFLDSAIYSLITPVKWENPDDQL